MKPAVLAAVALIVAQAAPAQQTPPLSGVTMIDLDGRAVRVQVIGLQDRRPGQPIIVFEAGATNSLEVWSRVIPEVAAIAPVVAYDRAGLGRSEWDDVSPTPAHVADRLRRTLRQVGADPPYVLVGFSWGGMLARYFAGYYPRDVAGLVLVDPGPMVTESFADNLTPFEAIGAGRAGFDAYWSNFAALMSQASPAARAEMAVFRGLLETDLADRDLRQVPAVPMVVLVAAKYRDVPLSVPFDLHQHFQADLRYRLGVFSDWVLASPHGTLVMANSTTHTIPREDPGLIVSAVQRVLDALSVAAADPFNALEERLLKAETAIAPRPPHLKEAVLIGLTRMGILHNLARLTGGREPDHASGGVRDRAVLGCHDH